jgi:pimeloyl-ACP methyl ester carboxylesterase
MAIETSPGSDGCYFSYWPQSNSIYLADQAGNAVGPLVPGSSGQIQNAQCSIAGSRSYASVGPDGELNVGISVTFTNAMSQGTKPLWSAALDGVDGSGWVKNIGGYYCVRVCSSAAQPVPNPESFAPSTRTGINESFVFDFSDANGATDIDTAAVLINGGLDSRDACHLAIDPQAAGGSGVAYFVTDPGPGGQVTIAAIFPGNAATFGSNNQCEIRGETLSLVRFGAILRVSVSITMKGAGAKQIYMAAQDLQGGNSGWANRGAWTAPTAFNSISLLKPGCQNAAACTEYSGLTLSVSNPSQPTLEIGQIVLTNVTRDIVSIEYTQVVLEARRVPSCDNRTAGESTGSPAAGAFIENVWTQPPLDIYYQTVRIPLSTPSNPAPTITRLLSIPLYGPGHYYFRLSFRVLARYNNGSSGPINAVHAIDSNCVKAGFAPEITGIRDDATGLKDEIERGSAGPYLQIYGNNVQGTFVPSGSSISPNTGISQWATTGVYPASGQVNLSYSVQSSAPTGQRSVTLTNAIGPSPPWSIWITDPSPQITSIVPNRSWQPGETVTVQIEGKGFGSNPRVSLRASNSGTAECLGSEFVQIIGPPQGTARDSQIVFTKSVPETSQGCAFDIEITSSGLMGQFFSGNQSSPKKQEVTVGGIVNGTRPNRLITFIVHGLSDSPFSFTDLRDNLRRQQGWRLNEFPFRIVDAEFYLPECVSIEAGARRLALHINARVSQDFLPGDRIAFIAHSMGGLIVRQMLAENLLSSSAPPVAGLVTLGTPHLGYPYEFIDAQAKCAVQTQQMRSYLRTGLPLGPSTLSPFLLSLRQNWSIAKVGGKWFAAGGSSCSNSSRNVFGIPSHLQNGCRVNSPRSDGVVCLDSSTLIYPSAAMDPTHVFSDGNYEYQHANSVGLYVGANVLCGDPLPGQARKQSLTNPPADPPADVTLFNQIVGFLNAL